MKRSSLAELESRFGRKEAVIIPWLIGTIAAVSVPAMALIVGWMIELLIRASVAKTLPDSIGLGPRLSLSTAWLDVSQGPLRGVLALLISAFGIAIVEAASLHTLYRWAIHYALDCELWIRRNLYDKNLTLASKQSVIGQQAAQLDATTHWIPQIREGLIGWYRTVPRHLIQSAVCFSMAFLIHPILMILAAIAFLLFWRIYSLIDVHRRRLRPVLTERIHAAKLQLMALDECGPLASSVQPEQVVRETFNSHLRSLRDAEFKLYDCTLWKAPFLLTVIALMVCVFCFALSVRILQESATLGVAGGLTMLVLIGFGYASVLKIGRAWSPIRDADQAAKRLLNLFDQSIPALINSASMTAKPLKQQLILENVTFEDTLGQKLVMDVSIQARPGMLIALVATSGLEARTIGEIVLGFGNPSQGRVLWDGTNVTAFARASIQEQCLWVAADGPMISGTLIENLSLAGDPRSFSDIVDAVKIAGAYNAVSELTDSFSTLISPLDDRLKNDALYQLGIARAILRKPSVVVAQEPIERVSGEIENQSVAALRHLTQQGSLVYVIPQRLSALRQADLVVLFHKHRVSNIGTHLELLERSELYRHLNYVRFSTLKDVAIS